MQDYSIFQGLLGTSSEDTQRLITGNSVTQDVLQLSATRISVPRLADRPRVPQSSSRPPRKRRKVTDAPITLSKSVSRKISGWLDSPSKLFLDSDISDAQIESPPLVFFYQTLMHLEGRRQMDLIRARFLKF